MIDLKLIRNNIDFCINELNKRKCNIDIKYLNIKDNNIRKLKFELNNILFNKKKISNLIHINKNKNINIDKLSNNINKINDKIIFLKNIIKNLNDEINDILYEIPNFLSYDVPFGDKSSNLNIYYWGKKNKFNFNIKSYIDIGKINNNIDFELSSKISGKKFVIIKNIMSRMYRALSQFMLDVHIKNHNYEEIYVPLIVNNESLYGSGQLPKFKKDLFYINNSNNKLTHALIPTSEVPLVNIMRNVILNESKLPIKFVSNSLCFRSEVGSYGINSKGLIRLHQFDKVEMVQFVNPNNSFESLESITTNAENILKLLNLHYRKVLLSANNTSFSSCKTYDLEVWFPYENRYIEVSSCSNTSDFQSRRISAKYKTLDNKINYIHILNGSGLAVGRTMAAIIENYQDKNMNINIPEILLPYMKDRL